MTVDHTTTAGTPAFAEAIERFQTFLGSQGLPAAIVWAFRDDICAPNAEQLWVRWPLANDSEVVARSAYAQAQERGCHDIDIRGVARLKDRVIATIWYPKSHVEAVDGRPRGLLLSVPARIPAATRCPKILWALIRHTPWYRRHQRHCFGIGTRRWAVVEQADAADEAH